MNLTHFHHTCMAGGKIYNSSRILHALLKKSYKTGGCLLKSSDQDHRIRVGGGGVGGLNSGLNFSIISSEPHPLGKIHNPAAAAPAGGAAARGRLAGCMAQLQCMPPRESSEWCMDLSSSYFTYRLSNLRSSSASAASCSAYRR